MAASCPPGKTVLFTSVEQVLRALPLFVFSYTCHQNIISVTNELHNPTRARNLAVAALSVGTALSVYVLLGSSEHSLVDSRDFNKLGIGVDDLIEGYLQTVMAVTAIDRMAGQLLTKKGVFRRRFFREMNPDPALADEIAR